MKRQRATGNRQRGLFLFLLLFVSVSAGADDTRVLFIGNSLTYWNEMPWMLERVAESLGDRKLRAVFNGGSGMSLRQHWDRGRAVRAIREGNWDYVVLQAQSSEMLATPDETRRYARLLDGEIRKVRAKTIVFGTWVIEGSDTPQAELTKRYAALAKELDAELAPVGTAWDELRRAGIRMFDGSGVHPSLAGTYLSACVFWATIRDESPAGATHTFEVKFDIPEFYRRDLENERIDERTARAIQRAAWKAVLTDSSVASGIGVRGREPTIVSTTHQ